MNPLDYYLAVLKKYAIFSGRSQRAEYWYFVLVNLIISFIFTFLDRVTGTGIGNILSIIYSLAILVPGIAVAIRRLHDVGKSGWWLLIAFIPLVGTIWLIVLFATDSNPGDNTYGPNPKGAVATK